MKFVPVRFNVNPAAPAVAELGVMLPKVGTGLGGGGGGFIVNVFALDVPPPGAGLNTVTVAVPVEAISDAEMSAVIVPGLTKVVGRAEPFQNTVELEMKLVSRTVSVKAEPPAVAELGVIDEIVGTGFC